METIEYDLKIKKPVKFWNRELSLSPKDFFFSLTKAAVSGALLDGSGAADNVLDAINSIAPEEKPAHAAWALVYKSLVQALSELIKEHEEFFTEEIDETQQDKLATDLENSLNSLEVGFNANFFDQPHKLPFLDDIKPSLIQWFTALGMEESQANALHLRLKSRFVLTLHKQWIENKSDYICIEEALTSPFVQATKTQRSWMQYNAWLQEQANERMFAEAFSLTQVYVPLRAYYMEKPEAEQDSISNITDKKDKQIVVDLQDELEAWVRNFDADSAIRIISGGPGSGKSSFSKIFSAYVAREITEVSVLFIPLHHFDPSEDITTAVEQFVRDERYLTGSPLDAKEGQDRLLIIFDGLDELSMQGKAAAETANYFVDEVIAKMDKFNGQNLKRQVLITGRDLAIQSTSNRLRGKKQILHVLPYFISEEDVDDFIDDDKRLLVDQRDLWWKNYGAVKGKSYESIPEALKLRRLMPITREPLLNYLVALSYERSEVTFSEDTTLNVIYQDLLNAVHKRQWDHGRHKGVKDLELDQFVRILEEISLAVWHGDGRTATVNQIYQRCHNSNLGRYLEAFEEGAKKGVSRLLTAFYFRQSEHLQAGDKTFEFTHKSFGEYLLARRIVRLVERIHTNLKRHNDDPDDGFDEREALKLWAEVCGPTSMDQYVFQFLCDEVASRADKLADWQETFAHLLGYTVRNGLPIEQLSLPTFSKMLQQSRNAEELLMVVHYACAKVTHKTSNINWGKNKDAFGEWVNRIQGQRSGPNNRLILKCLAYLNLEGVILYMHDFYEANLSHSNLHNAQFSLSCMLFANLEGANLEGANLEGANLRVANLEGAKLRRADLRRSNLEGAKLRGVDLEGANLRGVNLEGANLRGVNLEGANLEGANLRGVNLEGANLEGVNLEGANLEGVNLEGANLEGANLEGANLEGANLERAKHDRANIFKALFSRR